MDYVEFYKTNPMTAKRYRVIGYQELTDAAIQMYRTIGGVAFDYGKPVRLEALTIKLRDEEVDERYGTRDDLRGLFGGGVFYYTDHRGKTHKAHFVGKMSATPVTTLLSGTSAWFTYNVTIAILEEENA